MKQIIKIKCPTCCRETVWNETNLFRPFCSERCRLIDLGEWLSEKHVIAGVNEDNRLKD